MKDIVRELVYKLDEEGHQEAISIVLAFTSNPIKAAKLEFELEQHRAKVEALKVKLREHKSLWDKICPFTISIKRK